MVKLYVSSLRTLESLQSVLRSNTFLTFVFRRGNVFIECTFIYC